MAEFKSKRLFNKTELNKINQDLAALFNRLGMGKQVHGYKILAQWQSCIDLLYANNPPTIDINILKSKTFAYKLNKNMEIVIGVQSASLANELQFIKPSLLAALQKICEREKLPKVTAIIYELR